MNNQPSTVVSIVTSILPFLKIDDVDVRNVSRQTAQNLLRFADQYAEIHALTMQGDEVSGWFSNTAAPCAIKKPKEQLNQFN